MPVPVLVDAKKSEGGKKFFACSKSEKLLPTPKRKELTQSFPLDVVILLYVAVLVTEN
jgi:hypothetical protein